MIKSEVKNNFSEKKMKDKKTEKKLKRRPLIKK